MTNQFGETTDGIPISDGFDFPVGPRGRNIDVFKTHKIDATLADPAYFKSFGVWHPGEDWNGRGGGDTDLGDPIYAISNGRVVEFGDYPPSWGNIVLLEHVLPDALKVWSQYAHLDQIMVSQPSQKVERGQQIGTLGKGAKTAQYPQGRWVAHLHFEIRRNRLPSGNWTPMVRDKDEVLANYISPTPFINARRPGTGIFVPSQSQSRPVETQPAQPVHLIVDSDNPDPAAGSFRKAEVDLWYTAPYGFQGSMLWTYSSYNTVRNWGEWRPALQNQGQWQVWAFIPAEQGTTTSARYEITHLDGTIIIGLNQSKYNHQWAYLGTYRFGPGQGFVRLTDATGENGQQPTMIAFDALCWTKAD
jgi:hypothetical protein